MTREVGFLPANMNNFSILSNRPHSERYIVVLACLHSDDAFNDPVATSTNLDDLSLTTPFEAEQKFNVKLGKIGAFPFAWW